MDRYYEECAEPKGTVSKRCVYQYGINNIKIINMKNVIGETWRRRVCMRACVYVLSLIHI